jgi:pimeloyl-ACP methyl ester carboxylesterase
MSTRPTEHGYFRTRDGVRLFYAAEGPATAPPLLFCYGLVCSKLQWKYQMEHFARDYRVIYMDYRGHGQSARPDDAETVSIENCARDLVDLLDELKIPKATVLGHSLGVNIILDLYRQAPERVAALVLANGTPKDPFETMFNHNFLQVLFPLVKKAQGLFPDLLQKFWASQGTNPFNQEFIARAGFNPKYAKREDINEYLRITSTVDLDVFLNLLGDFMNYDATPWLHDVKAPTLVIAGERDLITPTKNQKVFAELIPFSELCVVKEGSHCSQMEKPGVVNDVIQAFLDSVRLNRPLGKKNKTKTKPKATARKRVLRPRADA